MPKNHNIKSVITILPLEPSKREKAVYSLV